MEQFFEKMRNADRRHKKKILIVATTITMIVIILAWILYMNAFVFVSSTEQTTTEARIDFWPTLVTGFEVTAGKIGNQFKNIFLNIFSRLPKFGGENNIVIQNPK